MQTYFIMEIQAMNDGSASVAAPLGYQVENNVDEVHLIAAYFSKCASAVQSNVDKHTIKIEDSEGNVWRGYKQTFRHGVS